MSDSERLKSLVNEYQLEIEGIKFWTPYWRNELPTTANPRPKIGPFKGKGTPEQIRECLLSHLESLDHPPATPEDFRSTMNQLGLGIDCSGLVYHVLEGWLLSTRGLTLSDHLYKSRQALLADFDNPAYTHPEKITRSKLVALPEQVSLSVIKELWGNEPRRLAGTLILTSLAANDVISNVTDIQPGDQVVMQGVTGVPHNVVITAVEGSQIEYAESGRPEAVRLAGRFGGVQYGSITVTDPAKTLNHQQWHSQDFIDEHIFDDDCVRRLKILSK